MYPSLKLDNYSQYVNKLWKNYTEQLNFFAADKNQHIFLNDMVKVNNLEWKYKTIENKKHKKNLKFDLNKYFTQKNCFNVPEKILPKELADDICMELRDYYKIPNWNWLQQKFDEMSDYLLYSNIKLNEYKKVLKYKEANTINILILGAGPTGLYIANTINYIRMLSPKINLLVIDNRIAKEGYRLPYTRNRIYGIELSLFSYFYPKIICMEKLVEKGGISIKYLENLLLMLAYCGNIPIYFTNKLNDEAKLKKFIQENKIDIIYDCTGGRLKNDFLDNKSDNNFFNADMKLENDLYQVVLNKNEYQLQRKNNIDGRFYLSVEIFNNGKYLYTHLSSEDLIFTDDIKFFSKLHNKCLMVKEDKIYEILLLFDNLVDLQLSNTLKNMIIYNMSNDMKFMIIESAFYHKIIISDVIKQKNYDTLYIATGDTIFSSHFAIAAGLNRLLPFIDQVVWYAQTLSH